MQARDVNTGSSAQRGRCFAPRAARQERRVVPEYENRFTNLIIILRAISSHFHLQPCHEPLRLHVAPLDDFNIELSGPHAHERPAS